MSTWRNHTKRLSKWHEMSWQLLCFGLRKAQKYYKKCVCDEMLRNVMKKCYILVCVKHKNVT